MSHIPLIWVRPEFVKPQFPNVLPMSIEDWCHARLSDHVDGRAVANVSHISCNCRVHWIRSAESVLGKGCLEHIASRRESQSPMGLQSEKNKKHIVLYTLCCPLGNALRMLCVGSYNVCSSCVWWFTSEGVAKRIIVMDLLPQALCSSSLITLFSLGFKAWTQNRFRTSLNRVVR